MGLTPESLVPRLGDYLVERRLLSTGQLQNALNQQNWMREAGQPAPLIGQVLLSLGMIDRETLDEAIFEQIFQLRNDLEEANRFLEKRVQERTAELELALTKLSELNQLKSNFVSNISHELRTPLTHIKGYVELLISDGLGEINEDQHLALSVMKNSSDRLERLIEDLLLFSMAEKNQIILLMGHFNIQDLCREMVNRKSLSAEARGVNLILNTPSQDLFVEADEEKITWAMMQLLDNAIKFTPSAGQVELKVEEIGKFISISVIDSGIGIPENKIGEIFDTFHQLDGGSTRRFGGTGLGLSLVKKIIEAHGSLIHVISEIDIGSTFTFLLKLSENDN